MAVRSRGIWVRDRGQERVGGRETKQPSQWSVLEWIFGTGMATHHPSNCNPVGSDASDPDPEADAINKCKCQ